MYCCRGRIFRSSLSFCTQYRVASMFISCGYRGIVTKLIALQISYSVDCEVVLTCISLSYRCIEQNVKLSLCLTYCTMLAVLNQFWSPVVLDTSLKTPFGLLLLLFQSQSHVTTLTHNYFLHCYTRTQLTVTYTFVTTITYSILALADFSAINYVSNYHRLYIFTRRNSRRELTPRIHLLRLFLKTATLQLSRRGAS
jgi:hypothetical protein